MCMFRNKHRKESSQTIEKEILLFYFTFDPIMKINTISFDFLQSLNDFLLVRGLMLHIWSEKIRRLH